MERLNELIGMPDLALLATVTLTFIVAGLVKGVVGLGLPTVAVGLLSMKMTPAESASILLVPSLVTNVWQCLRGPDLKLLLKRLWPMLVGIYLGTVLGGSLFPISGSTYAAAGLGIALLLYAALGLASLRISIPVRSEYWLSPVIGALTGIVTAATGVFVIPAVPYLQGLGLARDRLVQALGLAFTVSTVALGSSLAAGGVFATGAAGMSLYALLPALLGMFLGQRVRTSIHPDVFRKCFFVGLAGLGVHLALRSFAS